MTTSKGARVAQHRMVLFGMGGIAATALWALVESRDMLGVSPALYLAVFTFIAIYAGVALALAGPVPVLRALKGALLIGVPVTALVSLAGLRHVVATDLLDQPVLLAVIFVLIFVATPFLLVWLKTRAQWRSYAALFDASWTMTVRYVLACVFVGVFWLVVLLSNALFGLVGVGIIEWLLDTEWVPFALTGAMLGLGLAAVHELRRKISPILILRLLRLLVPVVLVVLVVFLVALPIRGLSGLFGEISAAATLMGAAIVAITLVSSALDRDDTLAVHTKGLRAATRGLALLLPLLAALATWAVVLRVRQYGWTPDRMLAATVAAFILAYGLGYGLAALRRNGWENRVRNVNVAMSLAIIGVSGLWLSPVLDPYRISANSQLARFQSDQADLDQVPFWDLQHEWGKSGQAVLTRLEAIAGQAGRADQAELQIRISTVREQSSKYRYNQAIEDRETPGNAATLARVMAVRPKGAPLAADAFAELPYFKMIQWLVGCDLALPDGRPGCVMVRGQFAPGHPAGSQAMVLYLNDQGKTQVNYVLWPKSGGIEVKDVFDPNTMRMEFLASDMIVKALDGAFDILPSGTKALFIGDMVLVPGN